MDKKDKTTQEDSKYVEMEHSFHDNFTGKDIDIKLRFKRPLPAAADRAQKEMMKSPARGMKNLCMGAVHPDDKEEFKTNLKTYPGLSSSFGGALLKACGFAELGN